MSHDRDRFLRQAQYCRDEAALRPHSLETKALWLRLADEYEKLAEAAESLNPSMTPQVRQQPQQQQQQSETEG
jgi:hypothetical protein